MSDTLIQSYVLNRYFVSTILRQSSCCELPTKYYETMWWKLDENKKVIGCFCGQEDNGTNRLYALQCHYEVCKNIASEEREASND